MAVSNACYSTREEALRALDISPAQADYPRIDRAIESARDDIDSLCHRRFYNKIETKYFDWPNTQRAYPWRIWLDASELADVTATVPVVTSGGVVIPAANIFWRPWNYSPPFNAIELNRSSTSSYGVGTTPQRDVSITGNFGYWIKTVSAGSLAIAMTDTTGTSATVASSASPGVGDVMIVDSESMLVTDRAFASTSVVATGAAADIDSDNVITVPSGTFYAGEIIQLDSEQMLITSVTGSVLTVKRAFNATVLATHSNATIYAGRLLTVARGFGGTTAATHLINASIAISLIPSLVKELAIAEALNSILQETTGYSRLVGEPGSGQPATGGSLPDLREQVYARFGRKARIRVI